MVMFGQITIDTEAGAGYIRYGNEADVRTRSERIGDDIVIDFTTNDAVLGIELLGFDADVLDVARAFAAEHALAFPRDIAAAFAAA
jgi:uncharacterized protein YuzE